MPGLIMGETICIASQKGGVGKTITAVNLSAALALAGKRTLLVDCDPQGSATSISGIYKKKFNLTLEDGLLGRATLSKITAQSCVYYLQVIPAPFGRTYQAAHLSSAPGAEMVLKNFLMDDSWYFEYIVIDTPAAFGMLTLGALAASDSVIIPTQCEYMAYRSLIQTMQTLITVKNAYRLRLKLAGILFTMADGESQYSQEIIRVARRRLGDRIFDTIIPRDRQLQESAVFERPLVVQDIFSKGAKSYTALASEIIERNQRLEF
jgi:chromosome partitioning protein